MSVPLVTLDAFAERSGLWPDLLKIDVEGFEVEVLGGAARCLAHARRVVLEHHSHGLRDECSAMLERAGFAVSLVGDLIFAARP